MITFRVQILQSYRPVVSSKFSEEELLLISQRLKLSIRDANLRRALTFSDRSNECPLF